MNRLGGLSAGVEHNSMRDSGLVIEEKRIVLTEIGRDFVQTIMNVFDVYDPPGKSMAERLEVVKKAKEFQRGVQERIEQ